MVAFVVQAPVTLGPAWRGEAVILWAQFPCVGALHSGSPPTPAGPQETRAKIGICHVLICPCT